MTGLRQVRGKGAEGSRLFSPAVPTARGAKLPEDRAEFEAMHDVAQRPLFGGLAGELGVTSAGMPIQAKMRVGEANDRYEQEADRLAPLIVRQINAPGFEKQLQDAQPELQEDVPPKQFQALRPTLQLKGERTGETVSPEIESAINSARGGGQPLEPELKERFGQVMGTDFSGVRVHTNAKANVLNQALDSAAFTTEQDIFFRQGEYKPGSHKGQELIVHELTHTLQQSSRTTDTAIQHNFDGKPLIQRSLIGKMGQKTILALAVIGALITLVAAILALVIGGPAIVMGAAAVSLIVAVLGLIGAIIAILYYRRKQKKEKAKEDALQVRLQQMESRLADLELDRGNKTQALDDLRRDVTTLQGTTGTLSQASGRHDNDIATMRTRVDELVNPDLPGAFARKTEISVLSEKVSEGDLSLKAQLDEMRKQLDLTNEKLQEFQKEREDERKGREIPSYIS